MAQEDKSPTDSFFATLMDQRFTIPGTRFRFGIDSLIGLIPGAGDWLGGFMALYFPMQAVFRDLPSSVVARMFFNILLDIFIGAIPLLGDLFDFVWKANVKNARLLEEYVRDPKETEKKSRWLNWGLVLVFVAIIILLLLFIGRLIIELFEFVF